MDDPNMLVGAGIRHTKEPSGADRAAVRRQAPDSGRVVTRESSAFAGRRLRTPAVRTQVRSVRRLSRPRAGARCTRRVLR